MRVIAELQLKAETLIAKRMVEAQGGQVEKQLIKVLYCSPENAVCAREWPASNGNEVDWTLRQLLNELGVIFLDVHHLKGFRQHLLTTLQDAYKLHVLCVVLKNNSKQAQIDVHWLAKTHQTLQQEIMQHGYGIYICFKSVS